MINRVNFIRNIGRFHDCKWGGRPFGKNTVIFGNNGNGKSTLTCILRSLATGNNNLLIARKTLGSAGSKYVELTIADDGPEKAIYFKDKRWSEPKAEILIFDSKFISENIFDGENISEAQKTNLHRVVIGEKGRQLFEQIKNKNEEVKQLDAEKRDQTNLYQGSEMKNYFTFDTFSELKEDTGADKKIQEKSKEYEYAKQLDKPKELSFKEKKFSNLEIILKKSVANSHNKAESLIKKHIKENWKDHEHSYDFLKTGTSLIVDTKDPNCPYCGQSLTEASQAVDAYKDYFDEAYEALVTEISGAIKFFGAWNYENDITVILSEAKDWVRFFDDNKAHLDLEGVLMAAKGNLSELKPRFEAECEKKIKNLNYQPDFLSLHSMSLEWDKVKMAVEAFNKIIKDYTAKSVTTDSEKLKAELGKLRSHRKRFSEEWTKICVRYVELKAKLLKAKEEREALIGALSTHSKEIFEKYQNVINDILGDMGADFKIKKFTEQKDLRKADAVFCGFELEFFGAHSVALESGDGQPNFKNTLSQGDKSALAFAFFLSLMREDENLESKILVFDDPVSSFDDERRRKTVQHLANIKNKKGKTPLQKIILTHENNFLIKLYEEDQFRNATYLRLVPDGHVEGRKKSDMKHCDIPEEFLKRKVTRYAEEFKKLLDEKKPVPLDVDIKGRMILENAFENKYHLELRDEITARRSLRSYVEKLNALGLDGYDSEAKKNWDSLFDDLSVPHHSGSTLVKAEKSEGDLTSIMSDTLKALKKV